MEFGKLIELVMEKYGYDRLGANAYLASMFYTIASDKDIKRVADFLQE